MRRVCMARARCHSRCVGTVWDGAGPWCVQVPGSRFLQGDFTTNETKAEMRRLLGGAPVDLHVDTAVRGCATTHCLGLLGRTPPEPELRYEPRTSR